MVRELSKKSAQSRTGGWPYPGMLRHYLQWEVLELLLHDPLHRVCDLLGPIRGVFQQPVEFTPAHRVRKGRDLGDVFVEAGEDPVQFVVRLVFQSSAWGWSCSGRASRFDIGGKVIG